VTAAIDAFIAANLPLTAVPFVPELRIHKAVATSGLRRLAEADPRFGSPYWAHYWNGGLALARYLLDHRAEVAGRDVLDLGTGSGLVAIAAAKAGARRVVAADVDPYAIAAAGLNAAANGVALTRHLGDLTREDGFPCDLILVGDLFYDRATAARVTRFLRRGVARGCEALIGDPWRAHLPRAGLEPLATFRLIETEGAAGETGTASSVFRFTGGRLRGRSAR
jgi:predicted nicotinamide N-methyase